MTFRKADRFEQRDGDFSAVFSSAARFTPIRIASDAIIDIIITQAAR